MTILTGLPGRHVAWLGARAVLLALLLQSMCLGVKAAEPQTLADAIIQARARSTNPSKESASFKESASPRKQSPPSKPARQAKRKTDAKQSVAEHRPANEPATLAEAILQARGQTRSATSQIPPAATEQIAIEQEAGAQAVTPSGPTLEIQDEAHEISAATDAINTVTDTISAVTDTISDDEPARLAAESVTDNRTDCDVDVTDLVAEKVFDYTSLAMPVQCAEPEEIRGLPTSTLPTTGRPDSLVDDVKPLSAGRTNFETPSGTTPVDLAAERFGQQPTVVGDSPEDRRPLGMTYCWQSSSMFHRALYFEDVNLERYGYSYGLWQPAVSAIHFFGTIPALPYLVTVHPQRECIYTLGYYRPGDCVPYQKSWPPLRLHAATVEAAALSAFFLWIP